MNQQNRNNPMNGRNDSYEIGILGGGQFLNDNKYRKELMVGPCTELTIDKKKVSYSIRYFFDPVTSSKMHEVVFIVGIK